MNLHYFIFILLAVFANGDPSSLSDPVLFCDGCFAMVSEIEKDMSSNHGRKLMERIETSLANICSTDRLRAYKFSPPTQVKTCTAILAKYRMSLTNILREQYRGGKTSSVGTLTNLFCTEGTKACEGREVPTLQQRKEREEAKKKSEEKKENEEL